MNKRSIQKIAREVNQAYCDSNPEVPFDETMTKRNLNFKASAAVPKDEAVKIMTDALFLDDPDFEGYNAFKPSVLGRLPSGSMVTLAREGSVCAYVKLPEGAKLPSGFARKCKIDECDYNPETNEWRLWFD